MSEKGKLHEVQKSTDVRDLSEIRVELDRVDRNIVELYEQRMSLCKEVAKYKISCGKPVLDKDRENEKLKRVSELTKNEYNKKGIVELFEQIMSISRKMQYQILSENGSMGKLPFMQVKSLNTGRVRVVFQGAEGAYSQAAMHAYFGDTVESFHVDTFRDAMCAIEEGSADFAVLPIENSTAGIVSEIYDLLVEFENFIVGEQIIQIEHCLLGLEGTNLSDVQTVYSHPQSFMQSEKFLARHEKWKQVSMQNNAFAAAKVYEDGDRSQVAIASQYAGEIYNLKVLEKGINHEKNNSTRFIVVTNQKIFKEDAKKVSICLEVPHESGSLYRLLSHFIYNDLNMTKIESRPIENRNWEYRFFIDFDGNLTDSSVKNALRGLRDESVRMKILGNY